MTAWRSDLDDFLATVTEYLWWLATREKGARGSPEEGVYGVNGWIVVFSGPSWTTQPSANASAANRASEGHVRRTPSTVGGTPSTRVTASTTSSVAAGAPNGARSAGSPVSARTTASRAPYPNRSSPSARTSTAAPGPSSPGGSTRSARPRTSANGRPASLPWAS